jgi:hypothetical protein
MHITIIVKKEKKNITAQTGTNGRARGFNAGLLDRSQFVSGRSCALPTRSRFYVVFLGSRANAELVPEFHVALHASHAALPMVTLKISPHANVTLTLGWITLFMGDTGEGALHREKPDLSSERGPHRDNTATFSQKVISGHKFQSGLNTKT